MRRDIPIIHIYTVRLEYTRMPTREAVSWTLYYRYDLEKFDKAVYIGTYTRICIPFSSIFFRARVPNSHNLAHWLVIISYTPLLKTIRTHTHTITPYNNNKIYSSVDICRRCNPLVLSIYSYSRSKSCSGGTSTVVNKYYIM